MSALDKLKRSSVAPVRADGFTDMEQARNKVTLEAADPALDKVQVKLAK
jgi:hypothetical protein